jgi:hypothetical protein
MWDIFRKHIYSRIERFIPVIKDFNKWKKHNWSQPLTLQVRQLIHKKHMLWTTYIETRKENCVKDYTVIRNIVRAATRRSKVEEQELIAKHCKENSKVFWSSSNSKRKNSSKIGDTKLVSAKGKDFSSVFSIKDQEDFEPMFM